MARTLYRSLTERLLTLPDHLAALPGALLRLGLRPRPVGQPGLDDRLRAPPQHGARSSTPRTRSSRRCVEDIPPAPEQPGRDRRRQPRRPAARRARVTAAPVELGLRENLAQFSLLVAVNAFVGAMVGLERSTLPLIGREDFGLASSAAVLSFIVAFGLAKALTNLGAGALAERRRPPAAADRRLGARAARAAADRASRRAGAGSSPPTSCSASTRASPGR